MSNNDMFRKDEPGGPAGTAEEPREFQSVDEASAKEWAKHMAPELDAPWNPLEGADDEEAKPLFDAVDALGEGDISGLVEKYHYGIREMRDILADFKNSPDDKKVENYSHLRKVNKYFDQFNGEIEEKSPEWQSEFFERVDESLMEEGITDRGSLIAEAREADEAHVRKVREEDEASLRLKRLEREEMSQRPAAESEGFFKGLFRR